ILSKDKKQLAATSPFLNPTALVGASNSCYKRKNRYKLTKAMMTDLRFALRQLLKSPGFTLLAILTLALGIGLNTGIFSLINDLFLRGLPFRQPARVLHVYSHFNEQRGDFPLSAPRFFHFRDGQTVFDGYAGENALAATVTGIVDPFQVPIFKTTANWFDVLGVRAIRGRTFRPEEEEGADVAVITDRFWKNKLGGDANVIGRGLTLDGVTHTIVGVIPKLPVSWTGPNADIWTTKPFIIPGFSHERMMRGTAFLRAVGRLKPGVTVGQAKAALLTLESSYRSQYPEKIDARSTTVIKTLPEDVTENLRPGFITLLAAVTFVLLIACSNVANLLLVRFSGRRREISLRMALGATRTSVLRLFAFESVLISLLAGAVGAAIAWQVVPLVPDRTLASCARVYDRAFLAHWTGDGLLSCTAKFARRHRGCAEGRRARHGRQPAPTAFSQTPGRSTGHPLRHPARRRVAAHHKLRAPESPGSGLQDRQSLGRFYRHAPSPVS
ncbi:MAG: hypothetical protein DMF04_11220, partial [Verrucomicrobia bacterium]